MTLDNDLLCETCGKTYPPVTREWRCACGGFLDFRRRPAFDPARIDPAATGLWRYRHLLPLDPAWTPISLGEVQTPLVPVEWAGRTCLFKVESLLPTGSFKDRGAAVLVTALHGLGVDAVVEDSSGNAGASLAAYAARAGLASEICVPYTAAGPKLAQMAAHGAEIIEIKGKREYAALAAWAAAAHGSYYASHVYSPYFLAGTETLAYEVWEQLDRRAPRAIFVPVGNGTLLLGAYRGFLRLREAGLIARLPRLVAVQAAVCAPLHHAFHRGLDAPEPVPCEPSRAAGVSIAQPARGAQILAAVRDSGGTVRTVEEDQIGETHDALSRAGFYIEETAAAAPAALAETPVAGERDGDVVVVLTGHGLKTGAER
ncbi:MAG: pyridoxal-phosphate dependent enzyme [Anaerolineae bacterium]|jgi:threonine synthase